MTIANLVEQKLLVAGRHTYLLDGDNIQHRLDSDLELVVGKFRMMADFLKWKFFNESNKLSLCLSMN